MKDGEGEKNKKEGWMGVWNSQEGKERRGINTLFFLYGASRSVGL